MGLDVISIHVFLSLNDTVRPGLKGPPVLRNAIVISRSPFLLSPNVALFCEIS